eukprot:scaffold67194_cov54-Attheya_sp.AAC.1
MPELASMMDVDSIWPAVFSGVTIMGAFVAAQASIQDGVKQPHKEPSLGNEDCPEEEAFVANEVSTMKLDFRAEFLKRSGPELTRRPIEEVVESRMLAAPNTKDSGGGANAKLIVRTLETCDDGMLPVIQSQMSWTGASWASEYIVPSAAIGPQKSNEGFATHNREHYVLENKTSRRETQMDEATNMAKIKAQKKKHSAANEAALEKMEAEKDELEEMSRRDALRAEATSMAKVETQKRAKTAANEAALEKAKAQATSLLALQQAPEEVASQMAQKEASSQAMKMAKTTASEVAVGLDGSKIDQGVQKTSPDPSQITDVHARAIMETNPPIDRDTLPQLTREKSDEAAQEAARQKSTEVAQETSKVVTDESADAWSARHTESEKLQESSGVKDLTLNNAVKDIEAAAAVHVANADGKAWDAETQGIAALERAMEYFARKCALKAVSQKAEDIVKDCHG